VPALAVKIMEKQQLVDKAKMTVEAFICDLGVGPGTRDLMWLDFKLYSPTSYLHAIV